MLKKRLIVCLDVSGGRVVKGVRFEGLRDVGDPAALAARYADEGADEVVFLDITAAAEGRRTLLDVVRRTAEQLFVPLTVGGGIQDVDDVERALAAGADKIAVNTAAIRRPGLITEAAARFGSQCVVASIDARRDPATASYRVFSHGGRAAADLDAIAWAAECAALGAGEVLITSIDRDGTRDGYDLELTRRVVDAVGVPVIASGGAGTTAHLVAALEDADASAALAAGMFHDGTTSIAAAKLDLAAAGVAVSVRAAGADAVHAG